MQFGGYELRWVNFGNFKLDGGSMFGSVPKPVWSKRIQPDDRNRILLATRCLLLKGHGRTILVDCGMGDKWSDKQVDIYDIKNTPQDALGIVPESISDLVLTHLHFDHAGGVSRFQEGELRLNFPKAKIFLQRSNLQNASAPNPKEKASYLKENVEILKTANLELLEGSAQIAPSIEVHRVNGHTNGQQWVKISDGKQALLYPTDLIPTSHHLQPAFHMGYDICAETLLKEKEEFVERAFANDWKILFEHDPEIALCKLCKDDKGNYYAKDLTLKY